MTKVRLTLSQYEKLKEYLVGRQKEIDSLGVSMQEYALQASDALGWPVTYSHIRKAVVDYGLEMKFLCERESQKPKRRRPVYESGKAPFNSCKSLGQALYVLNVVLLKLYSEMGSSCPPELTRLWSDLEDAGLHRGPYHCLTHKGSYEDDIHA